MAQSEHQAAEVVSVVRAAVPKRAASYFVLDHLDAVAEQPATAFAVVDACDLGGCGPHGRHESDQRIALHGRLHELVGLRWLLLRRRFRNERNQDVDHRGVPLAPSAIAQNLQCEG